MDSLGQFKVKNFGGFPALVALEALLFGCRAQGGDGWQGFEDNDGSAGAENSPRGDDWGLHPPSAMDVTGVWTRAMCRPTQGRRRCPGLQSGEGTRPRHSSLRRLNPGLPAAKSTFQNCCEDCLHIKLSDHTMHIVGA